MTRSQKADLWWHMKHRSHMSDDYIANTVGCSIATVRKYRKIAADTVTN